MTKRICHLLITFGNPNQDYTQRFLEELNSVSNDSHFVFCHQSFVNSHNIEVKNSYQQNKLIAIYFYLKLYLTDVNFRKMNKNFSKREKYKWIQLLIQKFNVIHIHHLHAIPTPVITYLKYRNVKIIASLRGRDLLVNTRDQERLNILKEKLSLVDEVHCISKFMHDKLYSLTGLKSKVIYRGSEISDKSNIKTELNQNTNTFKIISVGRLVWEKGHIYLIESVKRLIDKGFDLKVDIYGDGDLKEFLDFRIDQLKLTNVVQLKGFLEKEKLRKKYKDYDVAVQPSLSEALSNGLIDLMQHNIPCVITDVGGMPEIIKNEKNGLIFSIDNINKMDSFISNVMKYNFDNLKTYNDSIKEKFSLSKEVELFNELYN